MTNINKDREYTETEEERFFLEVQMSRAFLEEAMLHWNGEEFPMPGPSFVPPDNFLAAVQDMDHDVIPELIELWIDNRWYTLQSLVKTCNEIKPGSKAIGFVRKVCDCEFTANALGMRYSGDRDLKRWRPFLGQEAFSSYITHKMGLLNENGNVPDQVIVDLVMRKKQKGQNWGQVVFSIIEGAISDEKEENEGDPKLDQRLQGVELAALVTEQIGDYYDKSLGQVKITPKVRETSDSPKTPIGPSIKSITYKVLNKIQNGEELTDEEENVKKQLEKSKRKPPYKNYLSEYILKTFRPKYKDIVKKLESDKIISVQIALELVDCNEWFNEFVLRSIISNCKGRGKFAHRFRGATVEMKKRRDESLRDSAEIEESATDAPDDLVRHLVVLPKNN